MKNQSISAQPMQFTQYVQYVWLTLAAILAFAGSLYGMYLIWEVLLLFFVGFILAAALRPTVLRMENKLRISQSFAALLLQVVLFSFFGIFIWLVVPPLLAESSQLVEAATRTITIPQIQWESIFTQDFDQLSEAFQSFEAVIGRFGQSLSSLFGIVNSLMTAIILTITLFVVMYYFIISYDHLARTFAWLLPGTKEQKLERADKILKNVSAELGGWIRGRFVVMGIIGIITYGVLLLLGIPYALPLAIAATLLEIVPNIGPILAAIPAILIALFMVGPMMALVVLVFYTLLQQIESSLITPQIMKKAVDVHPLTTLFLIMVGLHIMGIKGGLLILPLYVVIRSVVKELMPHYGPLGDLHGD